MGNDAATFAKDLLDGNPIWNDKAATPPRVRRLEASISADIVIVGAGVSGAFMAHALAGSAARVVVVDRRPPGQGSTLASTAMLQFEIDTPLVELQRRIGKEKATRAWRRSYAATRRLISWIRREGIECGLKDCRSLYLAGDRVGFRGLIAECRARRRIGLPGEFLDAASLRKRYGIERTGAILSAGAAVANPVQLTHGILRRAVSRGVEIYTPAPIRAVMATAHGVVLDAGNHFIEARKCIFCTGYELLKGVPTEGTRIASSWVIATRPHARMPRWLDDLLIWEASSPYLYLRKTSDDRLIVGGADENINLPSYRRRSLARKSAILAAKAETLLPGTAVVPTRKWTGAFGESADGLPIIDAVPGLPNCFTVMGFGGNGTVHSFIAAEILSRRLAGRTDKDADLYEFRFKRE